MEFDLLISGAGPAGLCLARALADTGLTIGLVEQQPEEALREAAFDGREIALTQRSASLMRELGLWKRIQDVDGAAFSPLRDARVFNGSSPFAMLIGHTLTNRSELGWLVSNHHIRRAAYAEVKAAAEEHGRITLMTGQPITHVLAQGEGEMTEVLLADGTTHRARLLVAADSRFSPTRRAMGVGASMHDFGRTVLVARFSHTASNENTAYECFSYGRTIALLPLGEHMTNCVITIDNRRLHEITELSPEALAADLEQRLQGRLGQMTPAGSTHTYPLVGVHARRFSARRTALIGDAAVGMHPVTAHGFNLGLASADILAGLIVQAAASGQDIADTKLLEKYEAKHILHTRALYHGTNFVVKLFTNETPPAKFLRNTVLRLSNHLPPVKKLITKQLTG